MDINMRPFRFILALMSVMAIAASEASAAGIALSGKEIASQWCTSCHLVSEGQTTASADAPPFKTIAEKYQDNSEALSNFLTDPHPPMPDLNLSRTEIQDLVAYLMSLN